MTRTPIALLAALSAACAAATAFAAGGAGDGPDPERLKPSGIPMRLWEDAAGKPLPFAEYLSATRAALAKHRWKVPGESAELHAQRIDLVAPREWPLRAGCDRAGSEGVLLLHGLTDSPYLMRGLGDFLQRLPARCLLVRSLLLPGHGSRPGDMLKVSYRDWIDASRYGIESFRGVAAGVHLAGFSTGGAIAVYWAVQPDAAPPLPLRSLMLFSPAIQPKDWITRLTVLPRIAKWISDLTGAKTWLDEHDDRDFAKYESFPLNAGYQIYLLDEVLRRNAARKLDVPVFMALSRDDQTVEARDAIELFLKRTGKDSRMMLMAGNPDDKTVLEAQADKDRVAVLPGAIPAERVLAFAHTSFMVAPGDPHYGRQGSYAACLSYPRAGDGGKPSAKYCQCATPELRPSACGAPGPDAYFYGETIKDVAAAQVLRRLTFNPYFREMTERIGNFLAPAKGG
jgi:esterase/lipase